MTAYVVHYRELGRAPLSGSVMGVVVRVVMVLLVSWIMQVFDSFPLEEVYFDADVLQRHREMWQMLRRVLLALHQFPGEPDYLSPSAFREASVDYAARWKSIGNYGGNPVSPYLHILVNHVPEFLERLGTIAPFCMQSVEYNNHEHRRAYYRVRVTVVLVLDTCPSTFVNLTLFSSYARTPTV